MRYSLVPIHCRPWLLNGLSTRLIESHYENNYGGALRRLNAITEKLDSLDLKAAPGYLIDELKRDELIALNSTLLHELYFASLGGDGKPTAGMTEILARDFRSADRWRDEFVAMAGGLAGGSGWVLLVYVPRDRRLVNQYAAEHTQAIAGGIPILALDMYEHAYHIDFGAHATGAQTPFLGSDCISPGTFIAAVGADSAQKSELAPSLLAHSKIVVDVLAQSATMGDLHHAIDSGLVSAHDVHAELGDLVVGRKSGRTNAHEITVFDSTGVAVQDVASAAWIYRRAMAAGVGRFMSLGTS